MTPDEFTIQEFFLEVGDTHSIYVHEWGNAKSKSTIIFLHGGPGNGSDDKDKRKFNPEKHHVVFFDQRGSGRSMPKGELQNNTTDKLVEDINKVIDHLKLNKVLLVGGSWGSTLALCFAISYPEKIEAMVIDGVFTATKDESQWLEEGGWREFFPEIWQEYINSVPPEHKEKPGKYLFNKALGANQEDAKKAVYEYTKMELALLKLDEIYPVKPYEEFEYEAGLIEIHYLFNKCFLPENYILKNASKITAPVYIIQGRYDMICRPVAAYNLNKVLKNGQLIFTINGHIRQHEASTVQSLILQNFT